MTPLVGSEEWEIECRKRIHKVMACIHIEHPTISRAQEILGGYAEADMILNHLLEKKDVMIVGDKQNQYEFTFQGLTHYFADLLPEAKHELGEPLDDVEFASWCLSHSKKVLA